MSSFFGMVQTLFICLTVFGLALLYALHLPDSPAKVLTMRVLTIAGCVLYVLSPVDVFPEVILGPFGLVDDAVAAWVAAKTGYRLYTQSTPSPN